MSNGRLTGRCLDFGCGRGIDAEQYGLHRYDPYFYPVHPRKHFFDTVICIYVLNVITETEQEATIAEICSLLRPDGKAYFAVRRDLSGTTTLRGYAQRVVFLPPPFVSLVRNNKFELYELSPVK
jgi:2-polyprenyl-3-methyl-5-hydroxy-6-metoxy-1,4-benzoquinol methylase